MLNSSSDLDYLNDDIDLSTSNDNRDDDLDWDSCLDDEEDNNVVALPVEKNLKGSRGKKFKTLRKRRRVEPARPKQKKPKRGSKGFLANNRHDLEHSQPENLHDCQNQADIDNLRERENGEFLSKALVWPNKKTMKQALGDRHGDCVRAISGEATDHPTMASHRARTDAYEHTGRAFIAMVEANPSLQVVMATIVSGDGVTSSDVTVVDVEREIAKAKKFASKLTPDFFGAIEIVHFNSHKHDAGGRIIQVHSHMLMAGEKILAKAEAVAKTFGETLPGNFTDAPQIVVQPVDDSALNLMKVASYLFKPPHKAKTWCPPRDGKKGHMHHSTKGDRSILYFRMAMILTMLPLDKVLFAGGACKTIRSGVINDVRSNCKSARKNPDRMLAPDTIGSFWVEVSKVFKRHRWHLPVIITKR